MEDAEIVVKLHRRISRAIYTLTELLKRPGGPAWVKSVRLVQADIILAINHLTGSTEQKESNDVSKESTQIPDGAIRPAPPPAPSDKRGHLTQKELNEQITRCARVVVPCQTGWVCPKCGSVMAPHMSVCPNCSVQPTRPFAPYPGYPPEVTCGLRSATGDEHILAGGHQSTGPR